ncbi:MAG TPA: response regulator [Bdellovibrionales bacterium]|nr:response regulator [Bdellovibrionales bacterium]
MGIKLVIADDAPFIREVLRHVFHSSEVEIVGEAQDGAEAVQIAKTTRPDVVLMDIVMPKMSGIEATVEILQALPQTKIIACSTIDQNNMIMRALEAGCCHYVVKPFKTQEVLSAVRNAVAKKGKEAGV